MWGRTDLVAAAVAFGCAAAVLMGYTVIPAHSLASSSFDVNGTLGEQCDVPWWSSVGRIVSKTDRMSPCASAYRVIWADGVHDY